MSLERALQELRSAARNRPQNDEDAGRFVDLVESGSPYAELFYSELDDPAWIKILEVRGVFQNSPDSILHEDGSTSYPRSLALQGLSRLAPKAPEAAARIIVQFPQSGNIVVGDQLMRCMLAIHESEQVPRLLPIAESLISSGGRSTRLYLRDLLKSWAELGCTDEALKLLSTFIDTVVRSGPDQPRDQQTIWELSECDSDILAPLVTNHPGRVARVCFEGLCAYYDASPPRRHKPDQDIDEILDAAMDDRINLTYWLEDFQQTGIRRDDPGAILAHRLYSALLPIYQGDLGERDQHDSALLKHPWQLFTRIRCQLYADAPQRTLDLARREVFATIEKMNRTDCRHGFELASMLEAHSELHGKDFLSEEEVTSLVEKVLSGPNDPEGEFDLDERYHRCFWHHQLWPIRSLLPDNLRQQLNSWAQTGTGRLKDPELEDYKPFRSIGRGGFIQDKSPFELNELAALPDAELWERLNSWKSTKRWIDNDDLVEESSRKLAGVFTTLVAVNPERFAAPTMWWQSIRRPVMLSVPLEAWAKNLGTTKEEGTAVPAPVDLDSAFGIMDYVVSVSQDQPWHDGASEDSTENPDWWQARLATAHFLNAFVRASPARNDRSASVQTLLRDLATGAESRLDRLDRSKHHDWQFEAINSVRGEAWGAVLHIALKEKNHPNLAEGTVSQWIADLLTQRLAPAISESPAIYSLLGSQLRILVYVLPEWVHEHKALLFPETRPDCIEAITDGHLAYDQPHKLVAERLPEFPAIALEVAKRRARTKEEDQDTAGNTRDVSSRLGFHIAFYVWNDWFADPQSGERLFDRYLSVASTHARAETLSHIGNAFEKAVPTPEVQPLIDRAQAMLERWLQWVQEAVAAQIIKPGNLDAELGQFADLIAAECFPFDWRVEVASTALEIMIRPRWSFQLLDTLEQWSEQGGEQPERIAAGIRLLGALTGKLSEELRWTIQTKRLKPILLKGLAHPDASTQAQTNQVIENLLRHGFFELLDLNTVEN
jgi:hypothetical protein